MGFPGSRPPEPTSLPGPDAGEGLSLEEAQARARLCLALDGLSELCSVREAVHRLSPWVGMFKVGKELFTRFGPEAVRVVQEEGASVFLDLKYHDIPNTVRLACRAAAELGVAVLDLHASGGRAMMEAAREGLVQGTGPGQKPPKLVAVTVLTSLDQESLNRELRVQGTLDDHVLHLALLAQGAGLDGVVCSALDLPRLKQNLREGFFFVTPGIRGTATPAGADQKRVFSPGGAVVAGSSLLVVGRAILAASDPRRAAMEILRDMAAVMAGDRGG